ncbi:helix-turn-helix domain-containing protein [Acinetobacter baumannii]|nr:helix-turn-helix domain-containing protein [Acinetobacter baumannii]
MAIKNLKLVIEFEKLFEPIFADVLRTLRLAEEKACESADWHSGEASQLTGGLNKPSHSLETASNEDAFNGLKDRLKSSRKNAGITQEFLAFRAGTSQSVISQLESGLMNSTSFLPAIANVLGVDAYWLQTGHEDSAGVKINRVCLAPANSKVSKALISNFAELDINGNPKKTPISPLHKDMTYDNRR